MFSTSPSDHLPVELWEFILRQAFNYERSIRPTHEDNLWDALENLKASRNFSSYGEFTTRRETLRLVCKSWNTFIQSFDFSYRWFIISLEDRSYHTTPIGLDPILPSAFVRIDFIIKPSKIPLQKRFEDTTTFLAQLATYHPGISDQLSFGSTIPYERIRLARWVTNNVKELVPRLERLVLEDDLKDPGNHFPLRLSAILRLTSLTELRMQLVNSGMADYSIALPRLRILNLMVSPAIINIRKDRTVWEFPQLTAVQLRMNREVWEDMMYYILPRTATKVQLLDLSTNKPKEHDFLHNFHFRWKDFPSLNTLGYPYKGLSRFPTYWEKPLTLIVNDGLESGIRSVTYNIYCIRKRWRGKPVNKPYLFRLPTWQGSPRLWNEIVAAAEDYGFMITR